MFSGIIYSIKLLWVLFDSTGSEQSKMVASKPVISGLESAKLDSPLPARSYNILDSFIRLLDLENIEIVVKNVLMSCLRAEI